MPSDGLLYVIVVLSDHIHLLFGDFLAITNHSKHIRFAFLQWQETSTLPKIYKPLLFFINQFLCKLQGNKCNGAFRRSQMYSAIYLLANNVFISDAISFLPANDMVI